MLVSLKCEQCNKIFEKHDYTVSKSKRYFCGTLCYKLNLKNNHPRRKADFKAGQKLGCLLLLNDEKLPINQRKHGRRYWECQCECGKIILRREDQLLKSYNNQHKFLSCGCKYKYKTGSNNPCFKGCGNVSGGYIASIRCKCKYRGLEFNITAEDAWNQFLKQNGKCAYTGIDLVLLPSRKPEHNMSQTASIDRIDSSRGYTPDNIQWVHNHINIMKMSLSTEAFINWCKLVYLYSQKTNESPIL